MTILENFEKSDINLRCKLIVYFNSKHAHIFKHKEK